MGTSNKLPRDTNAASPMTRFGEHRPQRQSSNLSENKRNYVKSFRSSKDTISHTSYAKRLKTLTVSNTGGGADSHTVVSALLLGV